MIMAISRIPLGRYGKHEEFAKFVAFLLSGANTYIIGQSFLFDRGMVKSFNSEKSPALLRLLSSDLAQLESMIVQRS
ncbi:SDR family oxidoreductase [Bacillus sp. AGMB 02131]|uniref:SDR family oxidoreductase n=1 Tax=Peribacillus faecalis TaxID=2772559 RepID=A0A927CVD8_9BACI|nr:SDR family oxidoreductase [Peribacillus faecalis]